VLAVLTELVADDALDADVLPKVIERYDLA
jgi:hypothetical protein